MAFWFLNKQTGQARIFGSVSAICANTDLKPDALYYHFSRLNRDEYENGQYRVVKCEIERKKHMNC